jgi:hypothetical protein
LPSPGSALRGGDQLAHLTIEVYQRVLHLPGIGTEEVKHVVEPAEADEEQIRMLVAAELLSLDRCPRHLQQEISRQRRAGKSRVVRRSG